MKILSIVILINYTLHHNFVGIAHAIYVNKKLEAVWLYAIRYLYCILLCILWIDFITLPDR